ncbi:2-hydroxyacid dehydrogenase [Colwellia chukchiensis]|nr:glyoxylate/hydroxypyruvate reductase A [Colwellia chukchiensis]
MMLPFISQLPAQQQTMWLAALRQAMPEEQIVLANSLTRAEKKQCQLAIVANPELASLAAFEQLTWLHSVWAGVEHLMTSLKGSPIAVVRLVDPVLSQTMAQAALAWSLYLHRDMPRYAKQQRNKHWQQWPIVPANERRIGILGLGELGQASATLLQQQGFSVMGWSRSEKKLTNIASFFGDKGLTELLQQSDIVLCLLPLTPATTGLLNKQRLALLPTGAAIINFARGAIVDTQALLDALDNNQLSHAVLDVFEQEPLSQNSGLWLHPDITILPHISAPTNLTSASKIVAKNIRQFRLTGKIPPAVNKEIGY